MNTAAKVIITLFVLLLLAIGGAGYFFWKYTKARQAPDAAENAVANDLEEVQRVVALVEKHVVLPQGEEPTVATITDVSVLKDQPFFENAEVGYKVLFYEQARIAILYDPGIDRLINMSSINPAPPAEESASVDDEAVE